MPTKLPTACITLEDWTPARADELCPDTDHRAHGVKLCKKYDNPDYRRRLEFALANQIYSSCRHACVYDYDSYNTTRPHAFRWTGECYNVATGYYCVDDEVDVMLQSHQQAANLCLEETPCVERVAWSPEVAESNCPEYSNGDKGWGTAKVCPKLERRYDGFYDRADLLFQARFNLSLANHIFWSCTASCIYDIDDDGIAYQWKDDCWEMQTKYACFTIQKSPYAWALEYVEDRVCPSDENITTPAPTPFECVPRQHEWNEEIALSTCGYEYMGVTDKSSNATVCASYEDYQYRLDKSLANRVFHDCDAWCVYDIYKNAEEAFIWENGDDEQCYRPVTSGLCINTLYTSRLEMVNYVENILCESNTGEPTEAPTCIEQKEWSEDLMDEHCSVLDTGATYKHYPSAIGRAPVPCEGLEDSEEDLLKSLAMRMYDDCSSWCVYDYYSNALLAWKWSNSRKCWDLKSWGSCHWDYSKKENQTDWENAKKAILGMCTHAPTTSPTACMPYYDWNVARAEELCSSGTYGDADKSYGVQVCDDEKSVVKQASLEKSLANKFYDTCSSWCVYDYDTILNNTRTNSSDHGGFIWKSDCWKWVTKYTCFVANIGEFEKLSLLALGLCEL